MVEPMTFPTCSIDGCDNPHTARGWCSLHYARWHRTGDPEHLDPRLHRGILRIPLSKVRPAKRAMASAGQIRFDAAVAKLR